MFCFLISAFIQSRPENGASRGQWGRSARSSLLGLVGQGLNPKCSVCTRGWGGFRQVTLTLWASFFLLYNKENRIYWDELYSVEIIMYVKCVYMYICVYIYIYIHICIHTSIHTHTSIFSLGAMVQYLLIHCGIFIDILLQMIRIVHMSSFLGYTKLEQLNKTNKNVVTGNEKSSKRIRKSE